jgi:predicted amidohydrolase/ribosomal protein S18 acetylase RimI-like enzyme
VSDDARLVLRRLQQDDFEALVALQKRCFPTLEPWTRDEFGSQLERFPAGQIGIEVDGTLVASAASLVVDADDYEDWHDWRTLSDDGRIRNHDPDGDTLYGIEIQVDPAHRGQRLARRLYRARKDLCRRLNLRRIAIGGRIPGYAAHAEAMTAREYVDAVLEKRLYDPVLTAQVANGFVLEAIIPDYYPTDEDSGGYATSLVWNNLDHVARRSRRRRRRAVQRLRAGFVQWEMRPVTSFEDFAARVGFCVEVAADRRADVLLFPELFTLSLLSLVEGVSRPEEGARALAGYAEQVFAMLSDLAVQYNVNLVGGSTLVLDDDGHLRNVAPICHRNGRVETQSKLHITPDEARWWGVRGGDSLKTFDLDCGRVGVLICYDVEFPELPRLLTERGARVLLVPYNTTDRYGHVRVTTCARARAIENHLFVVTAGCTGLLPHVANADVHFAQSGLFTPSDVHFPMDGVGMEAPPNHESILVHEIDLELARRQRHVGTVHNWEDRRTDLVASVWVGDPEEGP